MFEADRPEHFTPRAHEVDAFMATGPLFVSDATSERLSAFEIEVATAKAVESVLSALDADLTPTTRLLFIQALDELAEQPAVGDGAIRAILSRPVESRLLDLRGAIRIAEASGARHSVGVLCEFQEKLPKATIAQRAIARGIAQTFEEPLASLVNRALRRHEIVGWFLAGRYGTLVDDHELAAALKGVSAELPDDPAVDPLVRLVTLRLKEAKAEADRRRSDRATSPTRQFDVASADAVRSVEPQLPRSFGWLAWQLFRVGSLDDDALRWTRLLDLSLVADPANTDAWISKIELLQSAGAIGQAMEIEAFVDARTVAAALLKTGHMPMLVSDLYRSRLPSISFASESAVRTPRQPLSEGVSPVSPRELLLRVDRYLSEAGAGRGTEALLSNAADCLGRSPLRRPTASPQISIKGGFGYRSTRELRQDVLTADDLLRDVWGYSHAREATGSGRAFRGFDEVVDASSPLKRIELKAYIDRLEFSRFFEANRDEIEALYSRAPLLSIAFLGKLVAVGGSGGSTRGPSSVTVGYF